MPDPVPPPSEWASWKPWEFLVNDNYDGNHDHNHSDNQDNNRFDHKVCNDRAKDTGDVEDNKNKIDSFLTIICDTITIITITIIAITIIKSDL